MPDEQLSAAGGASTNKSQVDSGCGDGAAGTIFKNSDSFSRLLIDNKDKLTTK